MQAFCDTYSDFHMEKTALKAIMQNSPQFGGVFLLVIGDCCNFHLLTKKVY